MASFDIILQTRGPLDPHGEPSDFVSHYTGIIICTNDETGEETKVGKIAALRIHAGLAHNAGESLFDVCDSHSDELHFLHTLLYEPDCFHFRDEITDRFDAMQSDLLVLDYVVLSPKWRKLKLGLLAVRKMVDMIGGGCGLAVSLIAPVRRDAAKLLGIPKAWLPRNGDKAQRRAAAVKLRGYYRRMGFSRLGRTPYYALPMNQMVPTASELITPTDDV
ncbi:MAG: hypothetical protein K8U57_38575 [Planctomycetes bacterium]|nr:hypothetical protein [Planctomycetota bacterium]